MMEDVGKLLKKAKWGKLTDNEISDVISEIHATSNRKDLYTLLHILGLSNSKEHKSIIESYLCYKKYPMVSSLCLDILCNYWFLVDEYLNLVQEFLCGVSWDKDDDVKRQAIYIAGRYLQKNDNLKFMQTLLVIFEDTSEKLIVRGAAYEALARSVGRSRDEIPSPRDFTDESKVDQSVLSKIRDKVQ